METKIRKLAKLLGSGWIFRCTLLVFIGESGWLALTSRFPMAFDEAYHFGLIQFFGHRLNPIVTSQSSATYRYGAIIQDPSLLYHYLMSFPYRLIAIFTSSLEIQAVSLRFVNIALAVGSLLVIRKLLKLMRISDALANIVVLAFALTPIVTVLSAQISYDNLLILLVSACVYETVSFIQQLDKGLFNTKTFLTLLCLCLFSSLVKFAFLPVLLAIVAVIIWKTSLQWRLDANGLRAGAKKSFAATSVYAKTPLIVAAVIGSLLFVRFYGVNLVRYHTPAPQCDAVLNIQDCRHYYAWNNNYKLMTYKKSHNLTSNLGVPHYTGYWFLVNIFELFGAVTPLQGLSYASPPYFLIIGLLGVAMTTLTIVNFKKILQENRELSVLVVVSLTYIAVLWARNYHDYLRVGQATFIHGRYLLPILVYLYILLALGLRYTLRGRRIRAVAVKVALALLLIFSFLYFGGFRQYISHVTPSYGHLNASNHFELTDILQRG